MKLRKSSRPDFLGAKTSPPHSPAGRQAEPCRRRANCPGMKGSCAKADDTDSVASAYPDSNPVPAWVGKLLLALVFYVAATAVWMAIGWGGPRTQHYLGLIADGPANLAAVLIAAGAARYLPRGPLQAAWRCMALALTLYFVGTVIGTVSWLRGIDPFPGVADVFYVAFYPAVFAAVYFFI